MKCKHDITGPWLLSSNVRHWKSFLQSLIRPNFQTPTATLFYGLLRRMVSSLSQKVIPSRRMVSSLGQKVIPSRRMVSSLSQQVIPSRRMVSSLGQKVIPSKTQTDTDTHT